MALRKKKVEPLQAIYNPADDFKEVQPLSGGNSFDLHMKLQMQKDINNSTGAWALSGTSKNITNKVKKYINDTVPQWWIMLKEQANYFCNQFQWRVDDTTTKIVIINTIRCAFYNGIAGVYYNDISNKLEAVALSNVEYDASGVPKSAQYTLANVYLDGTMHGSTKMQEFEGQHSIPPSKIKNLAVFKWGTEAISAWLRILPYVKLQHMLQTMMTTQSFAFLKKFEYVCNDPSAAKEEMEEFFNPESPFIIRSGFNNDTLNRFNQLEVGNGGTVLQMVEYYKEIMGIIYTQIGRRLNVDTKKERNVSNEVDASQENFDIVFKDTNAQFNIFIENLNEILSSRGLSEVELVLDDVIEEKKEDFNNDNESSFS